MLSVTFERPIVIDAANLHCLLSLANVPAVVAPYVNGHATEAEAPAKRTRKSAASSPAAPAAGDKPKRTRATKAEMEARRALSDAGSNATPAALEEEKAPVVGDTAKPEAAAAADAPKPKRDRRSAAQKAADAAKDAPKEKAPAKEKAGKGEPSPDAAALLERFAKLIDADFAKASGLLEEFGVKRFSELDAKEYPAFAAKLEEQGV